MKKTVLKRICAFILVLSTVLSLGVISFAQDKVVTVVVDGKMLEFDVNPVIYEGRTLVPMRLIFESLGAEVTWIDATKTAVGVKGDIKIEISWILNFHKELHQYFITCMEEQIQNQKVKVRKANREIENLYSTIRLANQQREWYEDGYTKYLKAQNKNG